MGTPLESWQTGLAGTFPAALLPPGNTSAPLRRILLPAFILGFLGLLGGCKSPVSERPIGTAVEIKPPLGLPPVPIPPDNPPTKETIALGRRLFYDVRLSKDNSLACASCHNPTLGFTDGQQISRGVGGMGGVRNAPTVANTAYLPLQFWDGRAVSLEEQAASPIADPVEMNQTHEVSVSKLGSDPKYQSMFRDAFGSKQITIGRVEKALASFERTILSGDSAFDRYAFGGDKSALTQAQIRGLALFKDPQKGNCATCHTIDRTYALFTDGKFHNIGEGVGDEDTFKDVGRYHETRRETDQGAFKTPTLRNVANTAPYMHDGALKTLKQVVDFYAGGGNSNPYLDKEIRVIQLSGQERSDLMEFLKSLTGELPPNVGPPGKE
ncbi:cytochrome c peroxidase [Granulicella sp. dw_53]|uniref:cytochrome-c peroxidase n=1 Tax=Granulicella sp. dw_53 TaxID=2719792 RepID=UPI001BD4CB31|nr:cytochrome c peroxidase [Granulicella sp. dw_53]